MRPDDAALDAAHGVEPADVRDVGGLARPGRDGAEARHDDDLGAGCRCDAAGAGFARAVGQQALEQRAFTRVEIALEIDEVDEARRDGADAGLRWLRARGAVWRCGNRKLRGRRGARSLEGANCTDQGLDVPHFRVTRAASKVPKRRRS